MSRSLSRRPSLTSRQKQLLEELAAEFGEKKPSDKGDKSIIDKIVDEVKGAVH